MPKIFVSYRRKSSEAITGRILDRLVAHYGKESIFIDIDNIPAGMDFRQRINQVLNEADIMIAVVGPKWAGSGKLGRIGIHRENDWVRLEVESALRRGALVIPVLVDGAQMPDASELPDSLKDFVYRNAVIVASGQDFHPHMDRLIRSIDSMVESGELAAARRDEREPAIRQPVVSTPVVPDAPAPAEPKAEARATAATEPPLYRVPPPIVTPAAVTTEQIPHEPAVSFRPVRMMSDPEPEAPQRQDRSGIPSRPLLSRFPPRYMAAAAAAAIAIIFLGYQAVSYLNRESTKLASTAEPRVVASDNRAATAARPQVDAAIPVKPPSTAQAAPAVQPSQGPATVPLKPPDAVTPITTAGGGAFAGKPNAPGCAARVAKNYSGGVGGPDSPVSIRPNLADANEVRAVAVSPNGRQIATAGDDGMIRLWDASSFKLIRTLKGHILPVYSLDYWTDGTRLASASEDGTVRVWDTSNGATVLTFDTQRTPDTLGVPKQYSVAFYPQPPLLYLASGGDDGTRIWNVQSGQQQGRRRDQPFAEADKSAIRSLSYAPNGSGEFVTGGYDGKARVYLTDKHQVLVLDANVRKTLHVSYSPDSSRIVTAGSDSAVPAQNAGALKIWTVRTQSFKPLIGHKDYVVSASWSADGRRIVSGGGGRDKSVLLWDAQGGAPLAAFSGHQADVEAVAFFAGGSRIVSVSEDKTIRVWDAGDRKELLLTAVGYGEKDYVVYTPDGCYAGSSGIESRLSIFADGHLRALTGDDQRMLSSPEGFGLLLAGR